MSQLQHLLSVQLSFLSAEPEGQESVTAPGDKQADRETGGTVKTSLFLPLVFFALPRSLPVSVPGVAEEPVVLTLLSPHQPLPEGGVV